MGLRDNIYVDLKNGDKVILRNGDILYYDAYYDKITNGEDSRVNYTDTLKHKSNENLDIVKIKRAKKWETIFTDTDRKEEDEDNDEISLENFLDSITENLVGEKLKKGSTIVINL